MDSSSRCLIFSICCILLKFARVTGEPSECYNLRQVFPGCNCSGAINSQGVETLDTVVDCSGRSLTAVPVPAVSYSNSIYEMRLNNNNITRLGSNILRNLNIRTLDLRDNVISSVDDHAFDSLGPNLKILYMNGNGSSTPPKVAFLPLNQLEELTLRNYKVDFLDGSTNQAYFLSLQKLKHLTLDNWGIRSIDPGSFNGPTQLLSLTLLNQALPALPIDELHSHHLQNLQKLTISKTPIAEVSPLAFSSLDNIQEIDLSSNHINKLDDNCFQNIGDTLVKLSLSGNILRSNAGELIGLKDLANLEELDLSSNENIQYVPNLSQLGTTKPLKLYLNNNKITSFPADAITGIADKLHTLDLSQNEIHTMDATSFNGATLLEVLSVSDQSGTTQNPLVLPPSLSQAAGSLKQLYLNGQEVDPSLWMVVRQLRRLEVLDLASTQQSSIPDLALEQLTSLRELDLSYNQLTTLTQESLAGPRDTLKYLYLSGNTISTFSSCAFYQYSSFPITMTLKVNPLTCDCGLRWLWERIKNNSITFTLGHEATCQNGVRLAFKELTDFCPGPYNGPQCSEYYTTTTVITPAGTTPSTPRPPVLTISVGEIKATSITISWSLSDYTGLQNFKVEVTNSYDQSGFKNDNIPSNIVMITATGLRPNTPQHYCVTALFSTKKSVVECSNIRTLTESGVTNAPGEQKGSSSEDVGIIIGAVIGSVVLLAILAAIAYLVFFRKRPAKKPSNDMPIQPRNFTKAELPGMSEESRTFAKPRKPPAAGVQDHKDGMQVVAISDGMTSSDGRHASNGRVGRAHMLNSDGSYKVMSGSGHTSPTPSQVYENDHGSLPPTPSKQAPPKGSSYYNMGYRDDKYDEVDTTKEIIL